MIISDAPPAPIGTQIRRLREERGLTLAALAELVGTSAPTMHRYEGGWDRFELATLRSIAGALGATLEVRLVPPAESDPAVAPDADTLVDLLAPLFWDHDLRASDLEDHGAWVLARVLMFGTRRQAGYARSFYGDAAIRGAIQRREVDARTRNYWNLVLGD